MYATLQYALEGHVATLTLNKPERKNAIGPEMANELLYAFEAADNDPAVRVVVLAANGKVFCAGGDFAQMTGGANPGSPLPVKGDYSDLLLAMLRMRKPTVAKVQGHALGGGLGLAAACSLAIASTEAQLGTPEVNVGLFPMMIMAVLARTMPRRPLLEMMLLGLKLDAVEAQRVGLINRAVAPDRLDGETKALATQLAAKSPTALSRGLAAYSKLGDKTMSDALPWLRDELYELLTTEDAREGLMAFMEKREPRWTGR